MGTNNTCNSPQDKIFFKNDIVELSEDKSEVKKSFKNDKKRQRLMIGLEKNPKKINRDSTEAVIDVGAGVGVEAKTEISDTEQHLYLQDGPKKTKKINNYSNAKTETTAKFSKNSNNLEKNSTSKKDLKKVISAEKGLLKLNEKKEYSPNYKSQNKIREDTSVEKTDIK